MHLRHSLWRNDLPENLPYDHHEQDRKNRRGNKAQSEGPVHFFAHLDRVKIPRVGATSRRPEAGRQKVFEYYRYNSID